MSKTGVLIWRHIFESGDAKRLAAQTQDLSDLRIIKDLPYINDNEQGHLFDIYELPELPADAPVLVNIHGGGLFAGYKEVNANFNYEWARRGYRVVSLSYRRIPETTLWHQIDDVMTALRFMKDNACDYQLNTDRCVLTGDSAGALLCLFALSLSGSEELQKKFGISYEGPDFRAAGLISIMLDTQRKDMLFSLSNTVTGREDKGKPWEKYLLDPSSLIPESELPPLYLVTSEEDLIRKDTLKLEGLLKDNEKTYELLDFPKGKERKLIHVFPVSFPMYPESHEVFDKMDAYFREVL